MDLGLIFGGLAVGIVVGLTGMGGGALMTPMLVFFFRVDPLVAIASDLVVSLVMKPAGAIVHLRRKTVNLQLVKWLCLGSVPAAFAGAVLSQVLGKHDGFDAVLKIMLGIALLIATAGLVVRAAISMVERRTPLGEGPARMSAPTSLSIKPVATVALGAVAGFVVGLTSVGAGSIIVVTLLLLYPSLKASQLVGTDLVQAIPLVAAGAAGHLIFGEFTFDVAGSLVIGAIPGAWIGAQISSRAPGGIIRRALAVLLLASGLKLLGVPTGWVLAAAVAALVLGNVAWMVFRRRMLTVDRARRAAGLVAGDHAASAQAGLPVPDEEPPLTTRR